jgi:hypothetical protein
MKSLPIMPALFALAAGALVLGEFLLFDRMTSKHHAWVHPRWHDQSYYLMRAYRGHDEATAHGLAAGLQWTLTTPISQGVLHQTLAVLAFAVVGSPSRSAALSLNILMFIAWQVAVLIAFRRAGQAWGLGWMAFGLLPCIFWPWSAEAGSAVDFRFDHGAMCLFGICAAVALLSRGFRSPGFSALLGLAISLTLLERFLTAVYFAALFAASIVWILSGTEKWARLRNLGLAALIAGALAGPVFWLQRAAILEYYWVGQVTGAEAAARAPGFGGWESVRFVVGMLSDPVLAPFFWRPAIGLTLATLGLAIAAHFISRGKTHRIIDWDWLFFGVAFLVLPAAVLCLNKQKSQVVLGVLVPGVVLLLGWIWSSLWPRGETPGPGKATVWTGSALLGLGALLAGGSFFTQRMMWTPHTGEFQASVRHVQRMADYFHATAGQAGLASYRLGVDRVVDFFDGETLRVVNYERRHGGIDCLDILPAAGILELTEAVIYEKLGRCDFVILTDQAEGADTWPYDRQMRRLYPQLKAWCNENLRLVESFAVFGRQMSLYQRLNFPPPAPPRP